MQQIEELLLEGGHLDEDGFGTAGVGRDVVETEEGAGRFSDFEKRDVSGRRTE